MALSQANVRSPLSLTNYIMLSEPVRLDATAKQSFTFVNRSGAYPTSGGYVAGVISTDTAATEVAPVATVGIEVVRVAIGETIAVDGPVASNAAGEAIALPGTGTPYTAGRALDSSTGSQAGAPHYIRVKMAG